MWHKPSYTEKSVDDRGAPVELATLISLHRERRITKTELRDLGRAIGRKTVLDRRFIAVNCLFLLSMILLFPLIKFIGPFLPMTPLARGQTAGIILGLWGTATLGFFLKRTQRIEAEHLSIQMLSRSQCPSCAAHLDNEPVQEDGCTVCPQCHAAWNLPSG